MRVVDCCTRFLLTADIFDIFVEVIQMTHKKIKISGQREGQKSITCKIRKNFNPMMQSQQFSLQFKNKLIEDRCMHKQHA